MKHALAPVAALLVGVSILLTGQGLQGTLLPVRAALENFSTLSIGIIGGAYFLGFTLGCLKCGELVQRVGHVRVFAAMTALASATPLLHGLILNPWTWGLLRFLTGFCFAILYVVIESWLNDRSSNENRGIVFSTYVMITLTVLAAGQMMTLLYDPSDMHLFAIASILVSIAAIPVVLSKSESPDIPETVELDIRRLYRISPAGMIGCVAVGLTNGAFWSLAPVFTAGYSTDASLAAWFMTSAVFGGLRRCDSAMAARLPVRQVRPPKSDDCRGDNQFRRGHPDRVHYWQPVLCRHQSAWDGLGFDGFPAVRDRGRTRERPCRTA